MVAVLTLLEIPFWDHIKGSESQGDYLNMRVTVVTYLKDLSHNTIITKYFETRTDWESRVDSYIQWVVDISTTLKITVTIINLEVSHG